MLVHHSGETEHCELRNVKDNSASKPITLHVTLQNINKLRLTNVTLLHHIQHHIES